MSIDKDAVEDAARASTDANLQRALGVLAGKDDEASVERRKIIEAEIARRAQ